MVNHNFTLHPYNTNLSLKEYITTNFTTYSTKIIINNIVLFDPEEVA